MARDGASVNGGACRMLVENPFSISEQMLCIAHTINNCGLRIDLNVLSEFTTPWLELVGGRHPHSGARALWRSTVSPQQVPGLSVTRWYSKAEVQFVLAENHGRLSAFLDELDRLRYGDATRAKLREIFDCPVKGEMLRLQLAAMLDMRSLVRATYELEGHRLELLLVCDRVEKLRALGRSLEQGNEGIVPNWSDATLRDAVKLQKGIVIMKPFPGLGTFKGVIAEGPFNVQSSLHPGEERTGYKVYYPADKTSEDLAVEELRPLLVVKNDPKRKAILECLTPAFDYLEQRITGTCEAQYDFSHMYEVCRVAQVFIPAFAAQHLTPAMIDDLALIKPLLSHVSLAAMKKELPAYLSAASSAPAISMDDVAAFSDDAVLAFWREASDRDMQAWKQAARIVFTISPNSASCERVFSLLKVMFGESQDGSLADYVQLGRSL